MSAQPALARRLGTGDAVVIGLGSMIGAGVFAAFAPAAEAAGSGLLIGLALAAVVAYCNATVLGAARRAVPDAPAAPTSTAASGSATWWGFLAGWGFVVGKTASCAAMALTFAAYAVPGAWQRPVAVAAVVALAAVNCRGVTRTAAADPRHRRVVLLALAVVVVAALVGGTPGARPRRRPRRADAGWYGVLQSAGLLFFAFAGYARIATLGEEVRDPRRTIPRAILVALGRRGRRLRRRRGHALLAVLGPDGLAATDAPLADAVAAGGAGPGPRPVVRVGAAAAALGALLALIAGVGRTTLAMARERRPAARGSPRSTRATGSRTAPRSRRGAWSCVLVLTVDLRERDRLLLLRRAASTTWSPTSPPSPRTPTTGGSRGRSRCSAPPAASSSLSPCRSPRS